MLNKHPLKLLTYLLITILVTLGLTISFQSLLAAWVAPQADPPNSNVYTPLNVGSQTQDKAAGLNLDGVLSIIDTRVPPPALPHGIQSQGNIYSSSNVGASGNVAANSFINANANNSLTGGYQVAGNVIIDYSGSYLYLYNNPVRGEALHNTGGSNPELILNSAGDYNATVINGLFRNSGDTIITGNLSVTGNASANDFSCSDCLGPSDIGDGLGLSEINETVFQQRVTGTCAAENSIRIIAQDGTVTCEADSINDSVSGSELDGVFTTNGLLRRTGSGVYDTLSGIGGYCGDCDGRFINEGQSNSVTSGMITGIGSCSNICTDANSTNCGSCDSRFVNEGQSNSVTSGMITGIGSCSNICTDANSTNCGSCDTRFRNETDNVPWGDLSGVPAGFADGVDNTGSIPSGLCMFSDTLGSCPSGWTRRSSFDGRTIRGAAGGGGTGGSGIHNHWWYNYVSTGMTYSFAADGSSQIRIIGQSGNTTLGLKGENTSSDARNPITDFYTQNSSSWPPYINVIVCCKN